MTEETLEFVLALVQTETKKKPLANSDTINEFMDVMILSYQFYKLNMSLVPVQAVLESVCKLSGVYTLLVRFMSELHEDTLTSGVVSKLYKIKQKYPHLDRGLQHNQG